MAYCTADDIYLSVPRSDIDGLTDGNDEIVTDKINVAEDLIDKYLYGVYELPLNPVDDIIKQIAVDISIYNLYTRILNLDQSNEAGPRRQRYRDALALLDKIRKKELKLTAPFFENAETAKIITVKAPTRVFTNTVLDTF